MTNKAKSFIMYGISGAGKTTELARFAKYIKKKYNMRSRLISASSGGWGAFEDYGLIDLNNPTCSKDATVQAFDITYREHALANIRQLSEGYWPRLGMINGGPLELVMQSTPEFMTTQDEWKTIGAYLIEGAKDISDVLLNHVKYSPNKIGFSPAYEYKEQGYAVKGLQDGHYGIVQGELEKVIRQGFHRLPIKYDVWTSMLGYFSPTGKDRDGVTREKHIGQSGGLYGPQAAGNVLTPVIPGWFGDCFHMDIVDVEQKKMNPATKVEETVLVKKHVAWFVEHKDDSGTKYLSKTRLIPELVPSLIEKFPYGFVPLEYDSGIEGYFEVLESVKNNYQKYLEKKGGM